VAGDEGCVVDGDNVRVVDGSGSEDGRVSCHAEQGTDRGLLEGSRSRFTADLNKSDEVSQKFLV
jgi:hypothetical protein